MGLGGGNGEGEELGLECKMKCKKRLKKQKKKKKEWSVGLWALLLSSQPWPQRRKTVIEHHLSHGHHPDSKVLESNVTRNTIQDFQSYYKYLINPQN